MSDVNLVPFRGGGSALDSEILQLEADIARKRARVEWSLGELRQRVDTATSWRHWARMHPIQWLALGLSIGLIAGSFGGGNRRRSNR